MNRTLSRSLTGLTGVALAAGAIYIFDPDKGPSRRAQIGERYKSAARKVSAGTHDLGDQLSHRYRGASARVSSWFNTRSRADAALGRRVRIDLFRALKDSTGIGVIAHDGTVILHGEVLPQQRKQVLQVVSGVPGVTGISDHLTDIGGGTMKSTVQGARSRIQQRFSQAQERITHVRDSLMQDHWTPTTRVCSGTLGLALLRWGATHRRSLVGGIGALTGAVLLVRSTTNTPVNRWVRRANHAMDEIPGAEPVAEKIRRAGDDFGKGDWRQSAAAS
jgi:BON domain